MSGRGVKDERDLRGNGIGGVKISGNNIADGTEAYMVVSITKMYKPHLKKKLVAGTLHEDHIRTEMCTNRVLCGFVHGNLSYRVLPEPMEENRP